MINDLIYDVGMHVGDDTAFYLSQGYRVVAVEADPKLVKAAQRRFRREIEQGKLEIVNVGVSDTEGYANFWVCENLSEWNSFDRNIASRDGQKHYSIQIRTMRFVNILKKYGVPYYLKIDIEGHDHLCLMNLQPGALPKYVSTESECVGSISHISMDDGLRSLSILRELGYHKFKLIDQATFSSFATGRILTNEIDAIVRCLLRKRIAKHIRGRRILIQLFTNRGKLEKKFNRKFSFGSSGVWGEDLLGSWLTFEEARKAYNYHKYLHFRNAEAKPYSFWCDWHATT